MFQKMVGLAFLTAGLAATLASSVFGSRASVAADAGLQSPTVLRALLRQKAKARDTSNVKAVLPEVNLAKYWTSSRKTSTSRVRRSWLPCKPRWSRPGKLTSSPNAKHAHQKSQSTQSRQRWRRRRQRWSSWKRQPKQLSRQRRRQSKKLPKYKWKLTSYRQTTRRSCHVFSRPRILSHIFKKFVREGFQALSGSVEAQPLLTQLELAFTGLSSMLAGCDAHTAGIGRARRYRQQPEATSAEACPGLRTLTGGTPQGRARARSRSSWSSSKKSAGFSHLKRHFNTTYCACSRLAATGEGPSLSSLAKMLVGEGLPAPESHQKATWTMTTANVAAWKSGQFMLDTIPHSDFWALLRDIYCEEASIWRQRSAALGAQAGLGGLLPGCRGWAALLGQPRRSGDRGPQHTSSSAPSEFETMLDDAAFMAPEGVEQPMNYLRSRILARHIHAMLKGGVTLVTVYLEPGTRASGLNLWLLEVLAACCLCFDGPWIAVGDWNMEPHELSQAGWLNTVNGKVFATSSVTCAGGAGAVLDYFVVSEAVALLVQQVEVVHNSAWRVLRRIVAQAVGNLAARRERRTHQQTPQRSVHTVASISLPDLGGSGTQAGSFLHKRHWQTPCSKQSPARIGQIWSGGSCFSSRATRSKRSMFRRPNLREAGGNGRRKNARARQAPGTPSPRSASTTASTARSRNRSCWSSNWGHGCRHGWTDAGQTSSSPTRRTGETVCHDPHSKRSTTCARRTKARLVWDMTASTPRLFCSYQSNCEYTSSICSWHSRPSWSNPCAGHT